MISKDEQVIVAQCTPQGSGAIALIRIAGVQAISVADAIAQLPSGKKLVQAVTHTIHYGWVVDEHGSRIDQVLFLLMKAPHTFTGQDTVEITCHNNQFIIQKIIEAAIRVGARVAEPGEFTQRAFQQGKCDLTQAEAINEIIQASSPQALKAALAQVEGSFSAYLEDIEQQLLHCLAYSEASFEFLDDDNVEFAPQIQEKLKGVCNRIAKIKQLFDQQKQIKAGIRIALIGSVNAGKSSLFNALLGKKRAIVSSVAGTTRDVIEDGMYHDGLYWTLIDTAGLRTTDDIIEQEGIERSHAEAAQADIIILVQDGSRALHAQEAVVYRELYEKYQTKIIGVRSKVDATLIAQFCLPIAIIDLSVHDVTSVQQLHAAIAHKITQLFSVAESPFLVNQRQYQLICRLEQELATVSEQLEKRAGYELISLHLQDALAALSEVSGKTISEKGMDTIFRQFCVGK